MKGHRTAWEDGYEETQNGLGRQLRRGTELTEKTAMKGHRTDCEDSYAGAQNGLGRRR